MSHINQFKENKKKQRNYTILFLVFWGPSLILGYTKAPDPYLINLFLKCFGLYFIYRAYKYSLCPNCEKAPGWGWRVKKCKACGEKLV
ncbi:hypothetical protein [Catenovulum maritimum]|uniref:Uncharacterized protein n=1 Tax=Catenovulum maritimum TaxID=1513271 RepID=A0A0J8GNN5_9ALTE|nr:hypothetical protein [Catenovulum maritimum]KMT64435.1 hypothetical protein XM47_14145 [Catenovulum maritimum]